MIEKNNENIYKLVSIGYFLRIDEGMNYDDLIFSDQIKDLIKIIKQHDKFVSLLSFMEYHINEINKKNISLQTIEDLEYVLRVKYDDYIRFKSIKDSKDKKEARKQNIK